MLQQLHIQNYAIIDEISIDFSDKLNIITGETGAGKSILVGALNLVLGERADTTVLLNREKKCFIEAYFKVDGLQQVQQFLKDSDLHTGNELVIRREISASGKTRAFINDTPVNLNQLQQLSSSLIDLHQQFDTAEMTQTEFQREVVDALAGNAAGLAKYQGIFRQWQTLKKSLAELRQEKSQFNAVYDYNQFLCKELEEAGLKENELEELESELKMLDNAEAIKAALSKAFYALQETEEPIVQQLKVLSNQLQSFSDYHPQLPAVIARIQSAQIELQDIADEIEGLGSHVQFDQQRIAQINERLSSGYRLLKKHGVQTTRELIIIREKLTEKLQAVLNIDEAINDKEKESALLVKEAEAEAGRISLKRQNQAIPWNRK